MGWGSSSDDYDDDDAGTFGADEIGGGTDSVGRDDGGDSNQPSASDYAAMEDAYDAAMGYDTGPDLSTNVGVGGGDDSGFRFYSPTTAPYTPPAPQSPISSYFSPKTYTAPELAARAGVMTPYRPEAVTYANGQPTMTFDPFATPSPTVFNMGRTQKQMEDRSFFDRLAEGVGDRLGLTYQNQRANIYDPMFDRFTTEGMVKTSDNPFTDLLANALAAPFGSTVDTATYTPMTGGPEYTYQSGGGLLGMLQDPTLRPTSEIEAEAAARQAQMGGDGDGGQPLIIPEEVAEIDPETGEPTQFPQFTPREYEYQPFVSKFYTIPSRFTQPYGLLG